MERRAGQNPVADLATPQEIAQPGGFLAKFYSIRSDGYRGSICIESVGQHPKAPKSKDAYGHK